MNRQRRQPKRAARAWWPYAAIVAAACAFCWPVFAGRIMLPADMSLLMLPWRSLRDQFPWFQRPYNPMLDPIQQYLPWRIYAVESVRSGLLPLWNPYAFCGTPFLANLQSALLYPLNLLFLVTGPAHGFGVSAILHLALGGAFTCAFLSTLGLRRAASLLGAFVVMFNGFTVTWLEYPTLSLWVFMWLPAILWTYERARCQPRSIWPVFCAAAVGVQFLGGHLQMSSYVLLAFALYAVVRALAPGAGGVGRGPALAIAAAGIVEGLALAAAQVLPTLELARYSGRVSHGLADVLRTAFPRSHFILYLIPNFYGNPVHYNYWGNVQDPTAFNFFETACYVGILPLFLSAWALRRWREPSLWFFGALAAFAALAAIGWPVYAVLYYVAPGFRELAGLGRVLCLAAFGLAGMAALGLDDLLARKEPSALRAPMAAAIGFALLAGIAVGSSRPIIEAVEAQGIPGFAGYLNLQLAAFAALTAAAALTVALRARLRLGPSAFAWACIGLLLADLFGFGVRFNPFTDARMAYPATEPIRWLQEHAGHSRFTSLASDGLDWMPHNTPMIFGLRDIHGSDSLRVRRSFELASGPQLDQAHYPPPDSPLLDNLGVRYLMTRQPLSGRWTLARGGEAPIFENAAALPRARVVHAIRTVDDAEAARALTERRAAEEALASPTVAASLAPRLGGGGDASRASFERDDPDAVILRTETKGPGILVLTDSFYPGWRARVDGRAADISRVDYGFRGVPVPGGEHKVEFRYDPGSFRVGLFISLLALAGLAAAGSALYLWSRSSAAATASRR